jgi:signal transduction histidine kinase
MSSFRDLPIKHKLTALSVLASGSALVLACFTFVVYDGWTFRDSLIQTVSTQAKMVGYNSAAALVFGEPRSARETLSALNAEPRIISAGVYIRDGKLFASYLRDPGRDGDEALGPVLSHSNAEGHRFEANHLDLWRPIIFGQERLGTIVIRADLEAIRTRQLRYLGIAVVVLLISTLGAILVSFGFQRSISGPILGLAMTARTVSRDKDFSLRARGSGKDEIGVLVETFNEMLARIQEQNQQLQKAHDELEQRVIERTTQLEAANKELEAFAYSVSHDLRAPLRSIDGFSEAILQGYGDQLDQQGRSDLQRVRAASQRMAQLIDDILNLSRVSRGEMRYEAVNLSTIARAIASELQSVAPERPVELSILDGVIATGDPRLLRVVLDNLLRNAWKFTEKHPTAKIEFGVSHSNGKPVYFVRDDGAGFDMAYAGKLFGAFQRLHAMTEFQGTGIGLATVQRIVHRHGGRVWAEGKVEQGAIFYFTL